jgi:predicted ester cyclase
VPDATFDLRNQYVGEEGVVEESVLKGTHSGQELFGVPPKGGRIELPLTIVFPLEGDKFWGERMYFDMDTLRRQVG